MRLFIDQTLVVGAQITLANEHYNYIVRVLRKREGDSLTLFNGKGGEYPSIIHSIEKRELTIQVNDFNTVNRTSSLKLHLVQSVAKGEKMEFVIQKATELGIDELTPLISERSVVNFKGDQAEKRLNRWEAIMASSCEQCELNILPQLHPPISLAQFLEQREQQPKKSALLILAPNAKESLGKLLQTQFQDETEFTIIIGPEGGLSDNEIDTLTQAGATAATLGQRILRTETAALSVISSLHAVLGDWK